MAECNYTKKYEEYLGLTFGKLTIKEVYRENKRTYAKCGCECGNEHIVRLDILKSGRSSNCGCIKRTPNKKHGLHNSKEYSSWEKMKSRCFNPNEMCFNHYGGRGITVCDEWNNSFEAFYRDMGKRPENTSLDRINVNGDYEPSNCRWATNAEQARNTTRTRLITYNGKTQCLTDWANEIGISFRGLAKRLKNMPIEEALTKPLDKRYSSRYRDECPIYPG